MTSSAIGDNVKCLATNCVYAEKCFRKEGIDHDDPEQSYCHLEGYCNNKTYYQDFISTL